MYQAFGHLSAQMLVHILLMNAVAPLLALAAPAAWFRSRAWRDGLFPAMLAQLGALWAWHSPPVLDAVMRSGALHLAMQASLFLLATWFWVAVLHTEGDRRWRAILALLISGKLFCLLGVLLVFAPRVLYSGMLTGQAALGDQQLAGLLMLVACPATYLVAGVVIAARWLGAIDAAGHESSRRQNARRAA